MGALDFPADYFDVLVCLEGIEHVTPEIGLKFLEKAQSITKPEGLLIISSPYPKKGTHTGNPFHIKEYSPEELASLLEQHDFEVVSQESTVTDEEIMTIFISKLKS